MRHLEDNGAYCFKSFGQVLERVVYSAGVARDIAQETESPIEAIFGVAATRVLSRTHNRNMPQFGFDRAREVVEVDYPQVVMIPQFWWGNYRIDWAFHANFLEQPWVFVECDGRDFHSSDEQIARDAKRDARIRAAGIPTLRFSGSDIYRHADECAMVVLGEIGTQYGNELRQWMLARAKRRSNGPHS